MATLELTPGAIVGTVSPDERRRVPLGRYLSREPIATFQVYRFDDGKTIVLKAVES